MGTSGRNSTSERGMRSRSTAIACIAALGLSAGGCRGSGGRVEGVRASASAQLTTSTTTTTAPEDTTTSSTAEAPTTTTTVRPSTTTTRAPVTTSTTARPTTTAPRPITPTTSLLGDTRRAIGWDHYATSADGRTLIFTYFSGPPPCSIDDGVQVEEAAASVRVTIFERDGSNGQACSTLAQQKSTTVNLSSPLGGRSVVDGARS